MFVENRRFPNRKWAAKSRIFIENHRFSNKKWAAKSRIFADHCTHFLHFAWSEQSFHAKWGRTDQCTEEPTNAPVSFISREVMSFHAKWRKIDQWTHFLHSAWNVQNYRRIWGTDAPTDGRTHGRNGFSTHTDSKPPRVARGISRKFVNFRRKSSVSK